MVSQRQRLARKRFVEANPHLFPKPEPPKEPSSKKKKKNKAGKTLKRVGKPGGGGGRKDSFSRKHPLRVPGMKPGESCFICKAEDHIAKFCPKKSEWEKNKICLLCRRRGHSLKNCPDKSETNDNKLCYNCGGSGHSLSKCPQPLQDGGTKFANCFICNEHGHLSKNCPKNTHGIYLKGGSCKVCGGVTHLAKDCPNKRNKDTVSATVIENEYSNHGQGWQGQLTVFRSGDDLEDDFTVEDVNISKKGKTSRSQSETVSLGAETGSDANVKKKKESPKVVNFLG